MALAAAVNYSCGEYDNAVDNGALYTDADGNTYENVVTFQGNPGDEVTISISGYEDALFVATTSGYESEATEVPANDDVKNTTASKRTDFPLTLGDDGIARIYGNSDIKTLYLDNVLPFGWNQDKLENLEYVQIKNAKINVLKFPALEKLNYVYLNACDGVSTVDVSNLANLETLWIRNTTNDQLTDIDLSNNTELKNIYIGGKNNANDALTYIDLTNNTKLEIATVAYNQLRAIKMGSDYPELTSLSLTDNKLKELNITGNFPKLKTLTANKNELTTAVVPEVSYTTLNLANNKLNFATLPIFATTYGNQAEYEVKSPVSILDLTDQADVNGTETEFTLNFTEDEDYIVLEPGKFQFLKALKGVVVTMTNAALPKLTLKTTAFDTAEPNNTVFNWQSKELVEGGKVISVPATYDTPPYIDKIGYWKHNSATIVIDGTKESVAGEPYNYMRIDLNEPLREGMKLSFTGFLYSDKQDASACLYIVFALDTYNKWNVDPKPDYKPGQFDNNMQLTTFDWSSGWSFNNVFSNSLTPNTQTVIIDKKLDGVKSFKLVRDENPNTEIYLTNIKVTRN